MMSLGILLRTDGEGNTEYFKTIPWAMFWFIPTKSEIRPLMNTTVITKWSK